MVDRKMNEADKERYRREVEGLERGGGGTMQAAPVPVAGPGGGEPGASICIRAGCGKQSVRNVEWEDEYCCNQCVVLHCDQVEHITFRSSHCGDCCRFSKIGSRSSRVRRDDSTSQYLK